MSINLEICMSERVLCCIYSISACIERISYKIVQSIEDFFIGCLCHYLSMGSMYIYKDVCHNYDKTCHGSV